MSITSDERIALWEVVNKYAAACGGDTSGKTMNNARMDAVVAVESAVEKLRNSEEKGATMKLRITADIEFILNTTYKDHLRTQVELAMDRLIQSNRIAGDSTAAVNNWVTNVEVIDEVPPKEESKKKFKLTIYAQRRYQKVVEADSSYEATQALRDRMKSEGLTLVDSWDEDTEYSSFDSAIESELVGEEKS